MHLILQSQSMIFSLQVLPESNSYLEWILTIAGADSKGRLRGKPVTVAATPAWPPKRKKLERTGSTPARSRTPDNTQHCTCTRSRVTDPLPELSASSDTRRDRAR